MNAAAAAVNENMLTQKKKNGFKLCGLTDGGDVSCFEYCHEYSLHRINYAPREIQSGGMFDIVDFLPHSFAMREQEGANVPRRTCIDRNHLSSETQFLASCRKI